MQNERSLSGVWPSRTMSVNFGLTDAVKARWQKMLCLSDYAPHYLTCLRDIGVATLPRCDVSPDQLRRCGRQFVFMS